MPVLAGETIHASDIPGDADTADVATLENTTSTGYTDLATAGPAASVNLAAGQQCLIILRASLSATGTSGRMSFAVSVTDPIAAADADQIFVGTLGTTTASLPGSSSTIYTAATSGLHTFTAKYRQAGGTAYFQNRRIIAIPR
jgi:hypothetical protein